MARPPPRAPADTARLRPFRAAAYAVYLAAVGGFSVLIVHDVVASVAAMSPGRPPATAAVLPEALCASELSALWQELEARRQALGEAPVARAAAQGWTGFRLVWLDRLRQDEARCGVDRPERRELRRAFHQLERVEDLYTTAAAQYQNEIGPSVEAFRSSLAQLSR